MLSAKYSILLPFSPAIEIRPSIVRYTCAFSANALHCSAFNPVNLQRHINITFQLTVVVDSREHPNLTLDVAPLPGSFQVIRQQSIQPLPHTDNPLRHAFHLTLPFLIQLLTPEYRIRDPCPMQRRVRIHRPNYNLQLTIYPFLLLSILGRQRERPNAFSIQAHVLREGLGERDLVALGDKVAHGKGIS
jgi:hypothetical protein